MIILKEKCHILHITPTEISAYFHLQLRDAKHVPPFAFKETKLILLPLFGQDATSLPCPPSRQSSLSSTKVSTAAQPKSRCFNSLQSTL